MTYSLGDFKDFDECISYVCELELRKERSIRRFAQVSPCKNSLPNGNLERQEQAKASSVVRVEAVVGAAVLDDVDEGCCLVMVMGEYNTRSDSRGDHIRGKSGSRNVDGCLYG